MQPRVYTFLFICLTFLYTSAVTANVNALDPRQPFTASVTEIRAQFAEGSLTSEALVRYYLARIGAHNHTGAELHAVNALLPSEQILALARQADAERAAGKAQGLLHGIPVLLKDNIDSADGLANTAGSIHLQDNFPAEDAFIVKQLRAAGALIIGRANLSEWANFRSTNSSSGWSSAGGQAKNPHDVTRSTCGSSAGSASAVAAHFVTLAVGTETDGSLVCPAAVNGIVTIKPTVGLLSRNGIIPISHSQDTAGPMAKTVTDAVYMLQAMVGADTRDSRSFEPGVDFTQHLDRDGLKGKRIGILRDLTGYHAGTDQVFEQQLQVLRDAGAVLVDELEYPAGRGWGGDEFTVLLHEFKRDLNQYLATATTEVESLEALIALNNSTAHSAMPHFGQELFVMAQARTAADEEAYRSARDNARKLAGEQGIDALLATHNLDMLIAPTTAPAWKIDHINGDHYQGSASSGPAVAGYPHISVPMGRVGHLPVGLSFFAGAGSEATLIEAAYAFEQLTQARVDAQFAASGF